jgi:hypothetical protein
MKKTEFNKKRKFRKNNKISLSRYLVNFVGNFGEV